MIVEDNPNNTIVFDIGSGTSQVGFAGEAFPIISIPSFAAIFEDSEKTKYNFDSPSLFKTSPFPKIENIFNSEYNFSNPEIITNLLDFSHKKLNVVDTPNYSALFSRPSYLFSSDDREKSISWYKILAEIAFETYNYSQICISPDALLSAYAHCFQTCTVVDFGWSATRIVPVIEGKINESSIKMHSIGGFALTQIFKQQMGNRHIVISSPSNFSPEQKLIYERNEILRILNQNCTFSYSPLESDFYAFINGTRQIDIKNEISLLSSLHWISGNQTESSDPSLEFKPVQVLISEAIGASSDKAALWQNIVTSGGFSSLDSYADRLQAEINNYLKEGGIKPRVHFPMNKMNGGAWTVWTGGSILGSSSIFSHFCLTNNEWKENGENIIYVKYFH